MLYPLRAREFDCRFAVLRLDENKIQDLFFVQPQLFHITFFISVGWLDDFLEPGSHGLAGWPAREARRAKFGVFERVFFTPESENTWPKKGQVFFTPLPPEMG